MMLAYKNDPEIKAKFLAHVKQHREADELVQGYGYWRDGKGCAVGCALHDEGGGHKSYETQLGIPERIAYLEDEIFEGLPVKLAQKWPERFLAAIEPGADLSLVWHKFAMWLLRDSKLLTITDDNREVIAAVVNLHVRGATGDQPTQEDWSAARSAAWNAAWDAARNAARNAVWSAAWSASNAAGSAAYRKMANKLISLLKAAK